MVKSPKPQKRGILKETQATSEQRTPRRNPNAVPFNGKENRPLYKKLTNEIDDHPENLSKDKKLQLYEFEFDENDPREKNPPKKKRQYTRKKKTDNKAVKFNAPCPRITRKATKQLNSLKSHNEVNDLPIPETYIVSTQNPTIVQSEPQQVPNPLPLDEPITDLPSTLEPEETREVAKTTADDTPAVQTLITDTPAKETTTYAVPITQTTPPTVPVSPSANTDTEQEFPAQENNESQLNNSTNSIRDNILDLSSFIEHTPPKLQTVTDSISHAPDCNDSFQYDGVSSISAPIAILNPNIHSTPNRSLQTKVSDQQESPNIDNMFGFEEDSLVSDEILPIFNIIQDPTPQEPPSSPLPTVEEIEAMLETETCDSYTTDTLDPSTTLPESSSFLMDLSFADCTTPSHITDDFTIPTGLSSLIGDSDIVVHNDDDIPLVHYKKGSRKSYNMRRRRLNQLEHISEDEENEETVPTVVKKKKTKKPKQPNKKEEELYNKKAENLNSIFREIENFQLAVE